jgi:hypothetical protein
MFPSRVNAHFVRRVCSGDKCRTPLGVISIPGAQTGDTFSTIQQKCADYAKAKAIDDFKTSGTISDLTSLQNDIDACTSSMDRGRQIRQAMILTVGLGLAGYLGFLVWSKR